MPDIKLKIVAFLMLFLAFQSCETGTKLSLAPYEILHDNSSKVWILNRQFENNIDRTPYNRLDKWVLTFYDDHSFVLTTLGHFADYSLHQGSFEFNKDNTVLTYKWKSGQVDENKIELLDRKNLIYWVKKENSDIKMHFIPMDKTPVPSTVDLDEF